MSKYRVYELAKEFHTDSKQVMKLLTQHGYEIKNHFAGVGDAERELVQKLLGNQPKGGAKEKPAAQAGDTTAGGDETAGDGHGTAYRTGGRCPRGEGSRGTRSRTGEGIGGARGGAGKRSRSETRG